MCVSAGLEIIKRISTGREIEGISAKKATKGERGGLYINEF